MLPGDITKGQVETLETVQRLVVHFMCQGGEPFSVFCGQIKKWRRRGEGMAKEGAMVQTSWRRPEDVLLQEPLTRMIGLPTAVYKPKCPHQSIRPLRFSKGCS